MNQLRWNILSKELKIKTLDFKKGKRLYAWLSVDFEERSTYKGKEIVKNYKIEDFLKPIIK